MGVPVFTAKPNHGDRGGEFIYPDAWQTFRPNQRQVDIWRPGDALCMVTGVVFDVLDIDPRNGGRDSVEALASALGWDRGGAGPRSYGVAFTPSDGEHLLLGRTGLAKTTKLGKGLDLQAGDSRGQGRGFVFIAPTVRVSKWGPAAGQSVTYRWQTPPRPVDTVPDTGLDALVEYARSMGAPVRRKAGDAVKAKDVDTLARAENEAAFDYATDWTAAEAERMIVAQCSAVLLAKEGEVNSVLGGAARVLGRFVAGGYLTEDEASERLLEALEVGGVHSDGWNVANRKGWTAATVIGAGLANGGHEPWSVEVAPQSGSHSGSSPLPASGPDAATAPSEGRDLTIAAPRLQITSAGDLAYWLQNTIGSGPLSGFFLRAGALVHTPLVDEIGYRAPKANADENGWAQIQAVTAGQLKAKIQYTYSCYKINKGKDGNPDTETPAMFSRDAAQVAIDAPEAMAMLRGLAGITTTPMVRADGSLLDRPGYDASSRFLFLPGPGVDVRPVSEVPTDEDLAKAMDILDTMLDGFKATWQTKDDLANYLGLLLTPMLRLVTPPTYKMFGIGAHQPGSGKTLLADIVTAVHGGVLRSEAPEDETEWRKQITSILATTSAPVVHIDNVTGVLKSSTLAGTLTAGQAVTDRVLGSSEMITTFNDRVWVVTGNNLSLGGDLVRRTIIITIDPNMPNPETRTDFKIADLIGWVKANRNEILWALLVMIRRWVAAGRPLAERAQSDSFALWERSVAGVLAVCEVTGEFDAESGKRAAAGGDDDGLVTFLGHLRDEYGDKDWTVAEILENQHSTDIGDFVGASRDWLPTPVLDKMARSEASGRKSLGRWLLFRVGRWVSDVNGAYVLRQVEGGGRTARWRVDLVKPRE